MGFGITPDQFWGVRSLHELTVLFRGKAKERAAWYELALFAAWHVAVFSGQAKAGKLKDFDYYRTKFTGTPKPPSTQSWTERKAERQRQMELLKRHQQQRQAPPRKKA